MAAYASTIAKIQADAEWLALWQNNVLSHSPAATMVNSSLSVTIPGLDTSGPNAKAAGPRVVSATQVQPLLGIFNNERHLARRRTANKNVPGVHSRPERRDDFRDLQHGCDGIHLPDDLAAFGSQTDALLASADYQAWLAKYTFTNPSASIVGRSVVLQVL